jgi:hypothetical protein
MVHAFEINKTTFAPAQFADIGSILNILLPLLFTGAGLIFLVMLLKAGLDIMTHGNNPEALGKAYNSIGTAVIGLVIVIFSFLFIQLIGKMMGGPSLIP